MTYLNKNLMLSVVIIGLSACTKSQVGTSAGGAVGAGAGYAISKSAWGAAIGGGAGALIGNELTKNN